MPVWEWPKEHRGTIESNFYLQVGNITATSPFTGQATVFGPQYQRFCAKITLPAKKGPDWRELNGLVTRLRGQDGKIRLLDYHRMRCGYDQNVLITQRASGSAGEPWSDDTYFSDGEGWANGFLPPFVVAGEARARGETDLKLTEFPASVNDVLRPGDLFEHRPNGIKQDFGCLYEVVRNCRTNADGETRVIFEPSLRIAVKAGDQIVLRYPSSVFRLASDSEGVVQRSLGNLGNLGLSFVEVLPE